SAISWATACALSRSWAAAPGPSSVSRTAAWMWNEKLPRPPDGGAFRLFGSEDVVEHLFGRPFELLGVFEIVFHVLEGGGVVGAVHNALVADDFVVNILVLDGLAVAVKLHHAPLGAEGEEDRQVAEVVEMVVY